MNWDDLRFIAAVARTGSLLGASARLGVDHTTVGRRVSACPHKDAVPIGGLTVPTQRADSEKLLLVVGSFAIIRTV